MQLPGIMIASGYEGPEMMMNADQLRTRNADQLRTRVEFYRERAACAERDQDFELLSELATTFDWTWTVCCAAARGKTNDFNDLVQCGAELTWICGATS